MPASGSIPNKLDAAEEVRCLTAGVRRGEEDAVRWFHATCFEVMLAEARRIGRRDEAFCLDVVQEAMLKCLRTIRPVDSMAETIAFARVAVRSAAYDALRGERRRRRREELVARGETAPAEVDDERLAWLESQLRKLPAESARLIRLRYRLGWSLARIGGLLGLRPGAVDGRIRRVVAKLKVEAEEEFDD